MAENPLSSAIRHIRALFHAPAGADLSDGQLLERLAAVGDEAAFEALVRRHGAMVLGVCRRVLGNVHDAEDSFQATFLVLARKGGAMARRDSLGSWLYHVAHHVATRARRGAARRRHHEKQFLTTCPNQAMAPTISDDVQPILDEELHRLPDRFRMPVLLCCLEGKSREEAARQLGWSAGTIKSRLERGRALLRGRLTRRGIALSAAAFASLLEQEALAAVPQALVVTTVQAAVRGTASAVVTTLVQGAIQAMFWNQIKKTVLVVLVVVAVLGSGTGLWTSWSRQDGPTASAAPLPPEARKPAEPAIAWGEPRDDVRIGLAPGNVEVALEEEGFKVVIWFENVGKVNREVLVDDNGDCPVKFVGAKGDKLFTSELIALPRAASAPPAYRTLKPGERYQRAILVEFEVKPERQVNAYANFPRPGKTEPVKIAAVLAGHDEGQKLSLNFKAANARASGQIIVAAVEPVIAWGEARNGLRIGLTPKEIAAAPRQKSIDLTLWYENVGTKDQKVQVLTWPHCSFMFSATKNGQAYDVGYQHGPTKATPAPVFKILKPGKRFAQAVTIPFEAREDFDFTFLPRPEKEQPLTLTAGLCVGRDAWDAAAHSGPCSVKLVDGDAEKR